MKCFPKIFCFICICSTGILMQVSAQQNKIQFVVIPPEISLPTVAVQPGCPLQFEKIIHLAALEGGGTVSHRLRNIGTKPIRKFKVGDSLGSTFGWSFDSDELLMPGQLMPQEKDDRFEIVPLSKELAEKLKLKGEMKGVVVLMVISVEFSDGTKYDYEKTYNAMRNYFENLDEALYQQKQRAAKSP